MSSPGRRAGQRGVNGRFAGATVPHPAQTSVALVAGGPAAFERGVRGAPLIRGSRRPGR